MKQEWKKTEKQWYLPGKLPTRVTVPTMKYFTITGVGNPNGPEFQDKIGALYAMAYGVRMMPKNGHTPLGYEEYTVYPLEGVWDLTDLGRGLTTLDKDQLVYKIMIRQPDFVNQEVWQRAKDKAAKKVGARLLDQVLLEELEDGLCVQMLHIGSFDSESASFTIMDCFLESQGLIRRVKTHKEIYLSDFRKTAPDQLKTVLRYFVEQAESK